MPFVEILGPPAAPDARAALTRDLTAGIVDGFGVDPGTVTVYFLPIAADDYGHAGVLGADARQRIFVKIHAYRRHADRRRAVAASVTGAIAAALAADPALIAVYFLERAHDEVAHGAKLGSD